MKTRIQIGLVAAGLLAVPLSASAFMCNPGKGYSKHGYGHPAHYRYMHPVVRNHQHPASMAMYDRGGPQKPHAPYGVDGGRGAVEKGPERVSQAAIGSGAGSGADLVDTAASAGSFTTLVDAIRKAGLAETLRGEGPYTVFAPTDEAFARIPESVLAAIVADEEALGEVLANHVVPGIVTSEDVARMESAETVRGASLSIDTTDGVRVDGATVVTADIRASNGIIHVIDAVMLPN